MDTKYVMDVFFQILNKLNHEMSCGWKSTITFV